MPKLSAEELKRLLLGRATAVETDSRLEERLAGIHGDLFSEHFLVDTETGEIGVIDFTDSGIGGPAYDVEDELLPWYGN